MFDQSGATFHSVPPKKNKINMRPQADSLTVGTIRSGESLVRTVGRMKSRTRLVVINLILIAFRVYVVPSLQTICGATVMAASIAQPPSSPVGVDRKCLGKPFHRRPVPTTDAPDTSQTEEENEFYSCSAMGLSLWWNWKADLNDFPLVRLLIRFTIPPAPSAEDSACGSSLVRVDS